MKKILKENVKDKAKELVNDLLKNISDITHKFEEEIEQSEEDDAEEKDIKKVISDIQEKISSIVTKYLPDFIKGTMKFLAKIDETNNSGTKDKSIIVLLIEKILKEQYHIIIDDSKNISKLINFYITKIASDENELIKFIIDEFSNVIKENTISFNITNDFYNIVNKTIAKLFTKDSKNVSIDLLFENLVPKLLNVLEKTSNSESESGLLEFINGIFTETSGKQKFIYYFIDDKKEEQETNSNIYLAKEIRKESNKNIIFPKFEFGFSTILGSIFKLNDITNLLNKFLLQFIKPIASLINDSEKQSDVKKALFRIYAIFTYFYYKYTLDTGIFDGIISFLNPFDPETVLKKLIEQEIKSKSISLDDILGEKEASSWFSLKPASYKIFSLAKEVAR